MTTEALRIHKAKESDVVNAFHRLAKGSLAKAREDGLITVAFVEASTEEELQILGPALTLFFSALQSVTDPPSVTVPASEENEPVNPLQSLSLDQQADVARLLCDLEPQTSPITTQMVKIAADLSSIAIAIAQRKTYLERYAADLEELMGERPPAPPQYTPPQSSLQQVYGQDSKRQKEGHPRRRPLPIPPTDESASIALYRVDSVASTYTQAAAVGGTEIPTTDDPELETVRQTFYAVLAEIITDTPRLAVMLREDPARGIYTSVALAIVLAASRCLTRNGQRVRVVGPSGQAASYGPEDAPASFRPLVSSLVGLGRVLRGLEEGDNAAAIERAMAGEADAPGLTSIERLSQELELGPEAGDTEPAIRSIANNIRMQASGVVQLPGFAARTGVFSILANLSR